MFISGCLCSFLPVYGPEVLQLKLACEEEEHPSKPVICLEDALFEAPVTPETFGILAPDEKTWGHPLGQLQPYHSQPQMSPNPHSVGHLGSLGPTVGPPILSVGPPAHPSTQPSVGTIGPAPVTSPAKTAGRSQFRSYHSTSPSYNLSSPAPVGNLGPVGAPVAREVMIPPTIPAPFEPAPGSMELPSVGSKGHYAGDCRPCAFLHAKGCHNGAMCLFCHLCDRGEKKRRQKAKKASFRGGA